MANDHPPSRDDTRASHPAGLPLDAALFARCFPGRTADADHLWRGDTCPAVVVSKDPWLIAVATDLNATGDDAKAWPVVAFVSQPLDQMTGGPPPVGARLAAAALYGSGPEAERWHTFDPLVAGCACSDRTAIDRAVRSIPREQWASFLDALPSVPRPYKVNAVYPIKGWRKVGATRVPATRVARKTPLAVAPPATPAIHRASLATLAVGVAFLGGLGAALVYEYRNAWALAVAAVLAGGAGWITWRLARTRVEISRPGLSWRDKGKPGRARWEDVVGYRVQATIGEQGPYHELVQRAMVSVQERRHVRFSRATDSIVVTLEFRDGQQLVLDQALASPFALYAAVLDQADPRIAAAMCAAVDRGESAACGKDYALAPFGLVTPARVYAWDEIDDASAIDGRVTLDVGERRIPIEGMASPYAVVAAVRALRLEAV